MNADDRRREILEMLSKHVAVPLSEMAEACGVTTMTISRDLRYLENSGLLRKMRGYAVSTEKQEALAAQSAGYVYSVMETSNLEEKKAIARRAAMLIKAFETVMVAPGTTTLELARSIAGTELPITVITNSVKIVGVLSDIHNVHLIVAGGELNRAVYSLIGPLLSESLSGIRTDTLFLGVNALDIEEGLTVPYTLECESVKAMMEISRKVVVLADHSKLNRVTSYKICDVADVDVIVTDSGADPHYLKKIRKAGVEVVVA